MSTRAGIVVTGTEVLSGWITDRNGPWVSGRLADLGVEVAHLTVCGDRPADLLAQLRFLAADGVDVIVTTGGLGPTADDLTVATVAEFCGLPLEQDPAMRATIDTVIRTWRQVPAPRPLPDSLVAAIDKQALIPVGTEAIAPTGTAPGVAVPATADRPAVLVLPGPPHELQAMWPTAVRTSPIVEALRGRVIHEQRTIRAYGLSEADLAVSLRDADGEIGDLDAVEVTTCMRGGELEIVSRFDGGSAPAYDALADFLLARHGEKVFSTDASTVDDILVGRLDGRTVATAESCTGGLVAARLTARAGSSTYLLGGVVSYANDVKTNVLGVPADLIAELGAVSEPVAAAMADGARRVTGADIAVSTTGIAGPDGARPGKPVGTVCFGLSIAGRDTVTLTRQFPGDRDAVRALATTAAMHLMADALQP